MEIDKEKGQPFLISTVDIFCVWTSVTWFTGKEILCTQSICCTREPFHAQFKTKIKLMPSGTIKVIKTFVGMVMLAHNRLKITA